MNNINITGNLTKDIELKSTQSGISVCSFNVAVKRPHTKDTTDFIPVTAWRQNAEYLGRYARKGNRVGISGSLTTRIYEDRDGNKRTAYEILADSVELLESRSYTQTNTLQSTLKKPATSKSHTAFEREMEDDLIEITDENLPF